MKDARKLVLGLGTLAAFVALGTLARAQQQTTTH